MLQKLKCITAPRYQWGVRKRKKKKAFPRETRNTNKLYYSTWQEIDPHICLHQAKQQKKNHVEAQRSGCIHVGALKFISKLKTRTEREREGDNLATTKSTCSLARQQLKVCVVFV